MRNKNKGFTLLELLAVIIILAVIALIAVPIILDIINDSKASAEESSVAYYASSVELTYAENMINHTKVDLRSGADSKTSGVKVVCETVGYLEGRGVVLDKCTVGSTISYNKLIDTVKADKLYYYLDKQVFVERPNDMDSVIASLDKEPINPPDKPSLTGDKIGDKVLEKFPNLALSNTEAKGCAISDNNYTYMGGCYLSGAQDKNYIWFSGFLYRIMGINKDGSIRLITEENVASTAYNAVNNINFKDSNAQKWLNEYFFNSLKGNDKLVDGKFCQGAISESYDLKRTDCTGGTEITNKVGLLSIDEYNLSGIANSYLNIWVSFRMMSPFDDKRSWIAAYDGSTMPNEVDYYAPFRPIINVNPNTIITEGDGSSNFNESSNKTPYILNENKKDDITGLLNEKAFSGEYVKLAGKLYRIIGKNKDNSIKLILDGYYQPTGTFYRVKYGNNSNFYLTGGIGSTLNSSVLNWLVPKSDTENLKKIKNDSAWYSNVLQLGSSYTEASKETDTPIIAPVGLIYVGEILSGQSLSIVNKDLYWTLNKLNISSAWRVGDDGFALYYSISYVGGIRPVININPDVTILSGNGTFEKPYQI